MMFPDPPAKAPEGYTLEAALQAARLPVPSSVACPHCHELTRAFAIVVVDDIPDDNIPGRWACSRCRLDYQRDYLTPQVVYGFDDLRAERNMLLAACDWTQLADVPLKIRKAWAEYRQALRDLPVKTPVAADVKWPSPPS